MKLFATLLILGISVLFVNVAYAQMDVSSAMDQAKQQAAAAASEKTDHLSTSSDAAITPTLTPTECATMMKEHYDNMKMDPTMMDHMKQCKAMMGDKMKGMNMDGSKMMPN